MELFISDHTTHAVTAKIIHIVHISPLTQLPAVIPPLIQGVGGKPAACGDGLTCKRVYHIITSLSENGLLCYRPVQCDICLQGEHICNLIIQSGGTHNVITQSVCLSGVCHDVRVPCSPDQITCSFTAVRIAHDHIPVHMEEPLGNSLAGKARSSDVTISIEKIRLDCQIIGYKEVAVNAKRGSPVIEIPHDAVCIVVIDSSVQSSGLTTRSHRQSITVLNGIILKDTPLKISKGVLQQIGRAHV